MPIDTAFIDELASSAPTPGGGGASAYAGALASALASMVGNLTVGKKRYADVEDEIVATMDELAKVRAELVASIDADAQAFLPLSAAYKMSKATPEQVSAKHEAMQNALVGAIEAPLGIMRQAARVIDLTEVMARKGSRMAVSDAGCAAILGRAALRCASYNVLINVKDLDDAKLAAAYSAEVDELLTFYSAKADAIEAYVFMKVRK